VGRTVTGPDVSRVCREMPEKMPIDSVTMRNEVPAGKITLAYIFSWPFWPKV
jgi:hypothetical protein